MYLNSELTENNFSLYSAKFYDNHSCESIEEFYSDLAIILHLKKLLGRYHNHKILKERLIINHMINLFNVFHPIALIKILFFRLDEKHHAYIKTFLVYLNRCPENLQIGKTINISDIAIDQQLLGLLKKC